MLNHIEEYFETGAKAGRAMSRGDAHAAAFHRRWFTEAKALERGDDKDKASEAFRDGYRKGAARYWEC